MNRNERLQQRIVQRLIKARLKPPTTIRMLLHWASLPLLTAVGVASVVALVAVNAPTPMTMFFAGMVIGAALRDLGIFIRLARSWPIQKDLFDWQKIEALAQSAAPTQSKSNTA